MLGNLKQYTILVVDDDEDLRDSIVFDLERKGFSVASASNGREALEIVKNNKIHVVLSDVRMPGGDGVELLENIRQIDPKVPVVILISGFADVVREDMITRGAQQFIDKPFEPLALVGSVFAALGLPSQ